MYSSSGIVDGYLSSMADNNCNLQQEYFITVCIRSLWRLKVNVFTLDNLKSH